MCDIKRQHHIFKLRYNKIDSNHKRDFPPAFIDDFIYEGIMDIIHILYTGTNPKGFKLGFEVTQANTDALANIVPPDEVLSDIGTSTHGGYTVTEYDLDALEHDYKHLLRALDNNTCGIINVDMVQHDDLNVVLNDEYRQPSKKWKRLVGVERASSTGSGKSLYIYSDYTIENMTINYIRMPKRPFFGGYDTLEFINGDSTASNVGSSTIDTDVFTDEKYCSHLMDIVIQNVSGNLGDYNHVNYIENKKLL